MPAALAKLEAAFPDSDVGGMVSAQPLLLVEDIEVVIEELRRCATCGRLGTELTSGWGPLRLGALVLTGNQAQGFPGGLTCGKLPS